MTRAEQMSIILDTALRITLVHLLPAVRWPVNDNAEGRPEGAWLPDPPQTVA